VAILSRGGVALNALTAGTSGTQAGVIMAIVDALFEHDEQAGVMPAHRDRRGTRLGEASIEMSR
jgi:hypothetical protein